VHGISGLSCRVVSSAETFRAEPQYFELAVIGNAFHRLDRDLVASRILGWLQPGGHLALCWSSGAGRPGHGQVRKAGSKHSPPPWTGGMTALGAEHRVPAGWDLARQRRPDSQVLSDAGFGLAIRHEFAIEHRWTLPELAGLIRSTSFLPDNVLGDQAAAFDADLEARLGPHSNGGAFTETVSFAYDLARKPD